MIDPAEILAYVKHEYQEDDDDRELTVDSSLILGGVVDSFSMVSLKCYLERVYGVKISDAEASVAAFDTVTSIVALVRRLRGDQ